VAKTVEHILTRHTAEDPKLQKYKIMTKQVTTYSTLISLFPIFCGVEIRGKGKYFGICSRHARFCV